MEKKSMTQKISFRFAERKDVPLILEFIKALAEYEKASDLVTATAELLEEWLFEKERAEVLFLLISGKEAGFALFFQSFAAYPGHGGIRMEWLCLNWNSSIDFYKSMGVKPLDTCTTFRLEGKSLLEFLDGEIP